ncbi:MAG TPA: ABC transporter permease [Anaerolineae bacterium]|nr:ABC transporter permease [Anaerolineae bacterium]
MIDGTVVSKSSKSENKLVSFLRRLIKQREMAMIMLILAACVIMTFLSPYFLSVTNFIAISRGFSMEGMVTIGMALLIITGSFDLSVGALMALSGIVTAWLIVTAHMPYGIAVLGGVGTGAFVGLINGILVTRFRINALIATLGTMTIARSMALGFTEGRPVIGVPLDFAWLGQGSIGGVPVPFVMLVLIALVVDILLRRGRTLRQLYYVGGNQRAARLSGIPVDRIILMAFVGSGLSAGLGGVITMARLTSGIPTAYAGVELRVIAACVIGGMSLSGGEGTILGALLGLIFMALVSNAMTLLGVSVYWEGAITGGILITAVALDMLSRRKS